MDALLLLYTIYRCCACLVYPPFLFSFFSFFNSPFTHFIHFDNDPADKYELIRTVMRMVMDTGSCSLIRTLVACRSSPSGRLEEE